jgi:hypothetical protein
MGILDKKDKEVIEETESNACICNEQGRNITCFEHGG